MRTRPGACRPAAAIAATLATGLLFAAKARPAPGANTSTAVAATGAATHDRATVADIAAVPGTWINAPAVQARLAAGQVVARSSVDDAGAHVDAAVRIRATPAQIWPLITQCRFAAITIPGLKRCRVLQSAPDGSWEVVEHDIRYSALIPLVHSVFRADLRAPGRMEFHRVSGDLKSETGSWLLLPGPGGSTTVEYRVAVQPGFWVPRSLVRRSLGKELPASLAALRTAAEHPAARTPDAGMTAAADIARTP